MDLSSSALSLNIDKSAGFNFNILTAFFYVVCLFLSVVKLTVINFISLQFRSPPVTLLFLDPSFPVIYGVAFLFFVF